MKTNAPQQYHANVTSEPHVCAPAETTSASIEYNGLSIDITGFDMTPETMRKVEKLTLALSYLLRALETAEPPSPASRL